MGAVRIQVLAMRDFQVAYAAKLVEFASAIDEFLVVTQNTGLPDGTYMPANYQQYLNTLETTGYDTGTIDFHLQTGLTIEQIDQMLALEIDHFQTESSLPITFYEYLDDMKSAALGLSTELFGDYGNSRGEIASGVSGSPETYFVDTMEMDFQVGNPKITPEILNLLVRPVDIPIGWTYNLSNPAPLLDPGETMTVTLTLQPDAPMLENTQVRLAVEGFINGEFIGGILYNQVIPPLSGGSIYLPVVAKP